MKPLITGIAILIILLMILTFQIDNYEMRLEQDYLKYCCDEASASASLFYDEKEFKSSGEKIYIESEGLKAIERIIETWLKTDSLLNPKSESYYTENIKYTAYFFNDNGICNVYKNRVKKSTFCFTYPYLFTDELMIYNKTIGDACIIVTIDAGISKYHLKFLQGSNMIRSSGYEYKY